MRTFLSMFVRKGKAIAAGRTIRREEAPLYRSFRRGKIEFAEIRLSWLSQVEPLRSLQRVRSAGVLSVIVHQTRILPPSPHPAHQQDQGIDNIFLPQEVSGED